MATRIRWTGTLIIEAINDCVARYGEVPARIDRDRGMSRRLLVVAGFAFDRSGELAVAGGQRALGGLLKRLAGVVVVRAWQHRPASLAGGQRELVGVELAGEH